MKYVKVVIMIMLLVCLIGGVGCSNQDSEEGGGSVKRAANKATEEIVHRMHDPINKAKATKKLGDERMKEMDKALKNQ